MKFSFGQLKQHFIKSVIWTSLVVACYSANIADVTAFLSRNRPVNLFRSQRIYSTDALSPHIIFKSLIIFYIHVWQLGKHISHIHQSPEHFLSGVWHLAFWGDFADVTGCSLQIRKGLNPGCNKRASEETALHLWHSTWESHCRWCQSVETRVQHLQRETRRLIAPTKNPERSQAAKVKNWVALNRRCRGRESVFAFITRTEPIEHPSFFIVGGFIQNQQLNMIDPCPLDLWSVGISVWINWCFSLKETFRELQQELGSSLVHGRSHTACLPRLIMGMSSCHAVLVQTKHLSLFVVFCFWANYKCMLVVNQTLLQKSCAATKSPLASSKKDKKIRDFPTFNCQTFRHGRVPVRRYEAARHVRHWRRILPGRGGCSFHLGQEEEEPSTLDERWRKIKIKGIRSCWMNFGSLSDIKYSFFSHSISGRNGMTWCSGFMHVHSFNGRFPVRWRCITSDTRQRMTHGCPSTCWSARHCPRRRRLAIGGKELV